MPSGHADWAQLNPGIVDSIRDNRAYWSPTGEGKTRRDSERKIKYGRCDFSPNDKKAEEFSSASAAGLTVRLVWRKC
jgi:hypothetical protein